MSTDTLLKFQTNLIIDYNNKDVNHYGFMVEPNYKPDYWNVKTGQSIHIMENLTSVDSIPDSTLGIIPINDANKTYTVKTAIATIELLDKNFKTQIKTENIDISLSSFYSIKDKTIIFTINSAWVKNVFSNELKYLSENTMLINIRLYITQYIEYVKPLNLTQNLVNCTSSCDDTTISVILPVTYKTKDGYVFKTLPTLENAYEKYNKLNTFTISEDKKTMTGNIIPDNDGDVKITVIAQQEEVIVTSSYINVFLPTDEQMTKLSRMRIHVVGDANGAVVDTFSYIRKLFQAFIPLEKTGEEEIKIADYFETGIMCSTTDIQLVIIKSDVMKINHKFNSIYDYEPFSTAKMYLPFVGIVDVGLNKLIDKNIYIEYACNVYTMNCVCRLYADDVLIDNFNGNFGVEFPYNCFSEDKTILDSKEYVYDLVPKIIITNKIPYEGEKIKSIDVTDLGKNFNGYIEGDKIYLDEITIKNRYSFITNSEISMIADCIKEGIYL